MKTTVLAAAIALAVYLLTLAPGLTEIDSGELAAVAATLGIAHPSGYPLFSLLGRVWTLVPVGLRLITWMNVLSAVLCAGSVALLVRVVRDLLPESAGAARDVGAWVAALAFAFHPTLWSIAGVTEVHALQMFLDAALLHALVRARLWSAGRFRESAFLAAGYLAGLCLTNHLTSALLLPAVALGAWTRRHDLRFRVLLGAAALGALGLSVYLFLPVRSAQGPLLDWGSPQTWEAFRRHVTGAQYQVWIFGSRETIGANLPVFVAGLSGFTWPLLLLAPLGLWRARRVRGLLPGTVVMAVCATIYPLGYSIHDIATYFLPTLLIVSVWIGLGAVAVAELVQRHRPRLARALPALGLLPVVPVLAGWRAADRSGEHYVESIARAVLETPVPDSVVLDAYWDALHSPAIYLQVVEGVRPDVTLLDQEHFRRSWNLSWLRRHHPELLVGLATEAEQLQRQIVKFERAEPYDPAEIQAAFEKLLTGILENGARRGGAYVTQETESAIGRPRVRIPVGMLFRLDPPGETRAPDEARWPDLPPAGGSDVYAEQARGYAGRMAVFNALRHVTRGDSVRARRELERALAWNPNDAAAIANLRKLEASGR